MADNNDFAMGYAMGQDSGGGCNNGYNNGGFLGGEGIWAIIIFAMIFGWGNGGWGGGFGGNAGASGALTRAELYDGFAIQNIDGAVRGVQQGICDSTYALNNAMNTGFAAAQNTMTQGFAGVNTGMITQGYESRIATNALGTQMSGCCCEIQGAIKDGTTQGIMNTNAIQQQLASCCCDMEKMSMQSRFDAQTYNCATLQAIDKLGDRIIDRLNADQMQNLRDENQSLRLAASQNAQNQFITQVGYDITNRVRPTPVPAYQVPNPYAGYSGYGCCGACA